MINDPDLVATTILAYVGGAAESNAITP